MIVQRLNFDKNPFRDGRAAQHLVKDFLLPFSFRHEAREIAFYLELDGEPDPYQRRAGKQHPKQLAMPLYALVYTQKKPGHLLSGRDLVNQNQGKEDRFFASPETSRGRVPMTGESLPPTNLLEFAFPNPWSRPAR